MTIQVDDDPALLELMHADMQAADARFRPTHFWQFYENRLLPELRDLGLQDFRRRHNSPLSAFGGTDAVAPEDETRRRYEVVSKKFARTPFDLRKCAASLIGNPEGVVMMDGHPWTSTHLEYCSLFADAACHIDLNPYGVFCELGTGLGRNAQILACLFEDATILMFDIPPQLYVANQFMSKMFGSRVIGYRAGNADPSNEDIRGKIVIQPAWRMPAWAAANIDLFWNSASFQEMEPDVVRDYLDLVRQMRPRHVYINAMPEGNHHPGKAERGELGTREPVSAGIYHEALKQGYKRLARYASDHLDGFLYGYHESYVFRRK
jgi:putative sugar O-methyltransferase